MTALHYEIRVAGSVPASVLDELRDVRVITHSVETVLRGPVQDQAALVGIINMLQGWGIELHAIRQIPDTQEPPPHGAPNAAPDAVEPKGAPA